MNIFKKKTQKEIKSQIFSASLSWLICGAVSLRLRNQARNSLHHRAWAQLFIFM